MDIKQELKEKIDEQILKNDKLKQEINHIQNQINLHKSSISKAKKMLENEKNKTNN